MTNTPTAAEIARVEEHQRRVQRERNEQAVAEQRRKQGAALAAISARLVGKTITSVTACDPYAYTQCAEVYELKLGLSDGTTVTFDGEYESTAINLEWK